MKYKINEILDVDKISTLLESYTQATGLVSALLDLEGNILSKSGWQEICTEFHRKNPETAKNCKTSDTVLSSKLGLGGKFNVYKCLNGLIDVAVPVVVNNEHLGNLFTGQFLLESPDEKYFTEQANRYNFDNIKYMKALKKVPIVKEEEIKDRLNFLLQMTEIIAETGIARVKQIQLNEALTKSERKYRNLFENLNEGFALHEIILDKEGKPIDYRFLEINSSFESLTGLKAENVVGRTVREILVGIENDPANWIEKYGKVALTGEEISFEDYSEDLGKWFLVHAFCPEKNRFAVSFSDISPQKLAEKELKLSETKFEKAFNTSPYIITIARMEDGTIIEVNKTFEKLTGYAKEEALNNPSFNSNIWVDQSQRKEIISNLKDKRSIHKFETTFRKKNGELFPVMLSASVIELNGQECVLSSTEDITERIRSHEALLNSERKFRALIEQSITGIYIFAKDHFLYVNKRFCEIFGYSEQEILSRLKPTDVIAREERERAQDNIDKRLSKKKKSVHYIARGKHKDNQPLWIEIHGTSIELDGEQVITGTVLDITDKYVASEEIKNSENKFRTLFEQAAVGVALADSNTGNYVSLNQKHCEIVGYQEDELLKMNFQQITHPEDLEKDIALMDQLKSGRIESYNMEKRYIQKNGAVVWVALNVSPLWKKGEKANFHIAVIEDITERKKNEAELLEYRENLEELVKQRTTELEEKNEELVKNNNKLERFNELFVDREFRIKELKVKIKELEQR